MSIFQEVTGKPDARAETSVVAAAEVMGVGVRIALALQAHDADSKYTTPLYPSKKTRNSTHSVLVMPFFCN